jgi:D-beta-D-heptose 7-phosphate kinase/D-beta-D-heptose 1-phosphate adenosyltransferase
VLVVGLNGDASIRSLNKSPDRPINSFENRASVMSAIECIDYVVGFDEPTPEALIRRIRPDVLVKGADWAGKGVVGSEFVETYGGRVILVPLVEGLSTTNIVDRIRGIAKVE